MVYYLQQKRNTGEGAVTTLEQAFNEVYTKFKLHFYQEIFRRFQDREASLTTVETFCMESIMALGSPTVNEFATFMRISPPNAAYTTEVVARVNRRFTPEDCAKLEEMLTIVSRELMPEVVLPAQRTADA